MPVSSAVANTANRLLHAKKGAVSPAKAREILHDGTVHGKKLTDKQRRFFGARLHKAADGAMTIDMVNEMPDEWRFANQDLILQLAEEAGWTVAEDLSVMSPEKAARFYSAKDGKGPESLNPNEDNFILVGDGGSDPAAEEYVFLPKGSRAIIAPKMSPTEKPGVSNAVKAIANTAFKQGHKLKKAQGGATLIGSKTGIGKSLTAAGRPLYTRGALGGSGGSSSNSGSPLPASPAMPAPVMTPAPAPLPYDPGVGAELQDEASLLGALEAIGSLNPIISGQENFIRRPGVNFAAARHGAKMMQDMKLHKAQYGTTSQPFLMGPPQDPRIGIPQPNPSRGSGGSSNAITPYQQAQLDLEKQRLALMGQGDPNARYSTDTQRAIAQMQIDAQRQLAAQTNAYNMQRLALDRLLGQQQLGIDKERAATERQRAIDEAQQLLATRAGRQMVAPGGNVIPSMQASLGRSIM